MIDTFKVANLFIQHKKKNNVQMCGFAGVRIKKPPFARANEVMIFTGNDNSLLFNSHIRTSANSHIDKLVL
jgi:hypothetical protein